MDYYSKYLKYKQKYSKLKYQSGGGKTILTKENTKIIRKIFKNNGVNKVTDKDILDLLNKAYKIELTEFIPHSDVGNKAIMWKIMYEDILVGFGVTTDLAQFEKHDNFEAKGGIKGAKGLYITSIAGNSEYKGVVGILFDEIDKYSTKNKYDYLLLEAKKYEPNYLVELYNKYDYISIKELTEDGETGTLMCKDIKVGFNCVDKIKDKVG
jgi:hypothetical protein